MTNSYRGNAALPSFSNNSLVAVIDLPDEQRRLVIWLMRQGPATLAEMAAHFDLSLEAAQMRLQGLLERGYAEAIRAADLGPQRYRANVDLFRRTHAVDEAITPESLSTQPIGVVLSSSGEDRVIPGTTFELSVTARNKGQRSAVIDVFLDDLPPTLQPWCRSMQTRLALSSEENSNVIFQMDVPVTALPGTYRYWLVVDAPQHYPDAPPLRYEQVLQILPPTETTVLTKDPTFVLSPVTRSDKPAKTLPGNPLIFQVSVYNRTNRVDRFRLSCPDLPEDWLDITYPQGYQLPGLVTPDAYLDLNPGAEGQITLTVTPPVDAIATTLIATLRLKSDNYPHLNLLEVLYLEVLPVYQVDLSFRTLISQVQTQPGMYSIQVSNRGNTPRHLTFQIEAGQNTKFCDFCLEPEQLTLAPQQTLTARLRVQPNKPLKRPFIGGGRLIQFSVIAIDDDTFPLPEIPMQGTLLWQARPWWQVLPVFLLLFGTIAGLVILTWWFFIRPPESAKILKFSPEETQYSAANGDTVRLGFQISNPNRLRAIELIGQSSDGNVISGPLTFDLRQGLPKALEPFCTLQPKVLTCRNLRTDARRAGDYLFTLTLVPKPWRNAQPAQKTAPPVTIEPLPNPEILEFVAGQAVYPEAPPPPSEDPKKNSQKPQARELTAQPPDPLAFSPSRPQTDPYVVRVNWKIRHPQYLRGLTLVGKTAEGNAVTPLYEFDFRQGIPKELQDFCVLEAELVCVDVPTGARQVGDYHFELQAIPSSGDVSEPILQTSDPVMIQPRPPRLLKFTINGEPAQPNYLIPFDQGQSPIEMIVTWEVENNAGTAVSLMPAPGTVPIKGSIPIPLSPEPGETLVTLTVANPIGEQLTRSVTITTYDPTPGPDTVVINGEQSGAATGGGSANGGGADANTGNNAVPRRPGQASPQELPPQFD